MRAARTAFRRAWVARIRASLAGLTPRFSSNRMLAEYLEQLYLPAADAHQRRVDHNLALARELDQWGRALRRHWPEIHWGNLEVTDDGGEHTFRVQVYLGGLAPQSVGVQLYAQPADGRPAECHVMTSDHPLPGAAGGYLYVGRVPAARPAGHYTPRVVPSHAQARVPAEATYIHWFPG